MDTIEIPLTQGKVAIIDAVDWDLVKDFKWHTQKNHLCSYAIANIKRNGKRTTIGMHQILMGTYSKMHVDHINNDGLDNRRNNLRVCTVSQNRANSKTHLNNTSGYRGVSFKKNTNRWKSQIRINKKLYDLGEFDLKEDAARVYDIISREWYGEYATLNFP